MPAKIINEMPLPMPFSVTISPIQTNNIVVAVMQRMMVVVFIHSPPPRPMPVMAPCSSRVLSNAQPWSIAKGTVR